MIYSFRCDIIIAYDRPTVGFYDFRRQNAEKRHGSLRSETEKERMKKDQNDSRCKPKGRRRKDDNSRKSRFVHGGKRSKGTSCRS